MSLANVDTFASLQGLSESKAVRIGNQTYAFTPRLTARAVERVADFCMDDELANPADMQAIRELLAVGCALLGATAEEPFMDPAPFIREREERRQQLADSDKVD